MRKQIVYLAGGFHSDWRKEVRIKTEQFLGESLFDFISPEAKPDKHYSEYATWDIHWLKQADIVFAYLDKNNPSGYGTAAELGYAKALNKTVIFVLEPGHEKDKYLQFLKQFADMVFTTLEEGMEFLKTF